MNPKLIVVGVDTSPRSAPVLEAARIMADRLSAKVVLTAAIEGMELQGLVPPELAAWNDAGVWVELEKQLRSAVSDAAARFPTGVVVEQRVAPGQAWRLIVDTAKEHKAVLTIVGAHAYRPVERLLGTNASKVANRAESSVLIVRQAAGHNAPVGFERIAVGLDGSERSPQVLQSAISLAAQSSGRLILVRAVQPPQEVSSAVWGKRPDEIMSLLEGNAKASIEKVRGELPDRVPAESVARIGAPAEVVLDVAKDKDAELVVIGSHGFDTIDRLLGTTAGRVVNAADRSVLIVRGAGL